MASVPRDVGCVVDVTGLCAVLCRVEAAIVSVGAGAGVWFVVIADPGVELELKVESGMLCETAVARPME